MRAIYELAVDQPSMDMPELVWKSWIDFEYDVEDYERARDLYERLLRRTSHVKVWVSFAQFEANVGLAEAAALSGEGDDEDEEEEAGEAAEKQPVEVDQEAVEEAKRQGLERARKVFERGYADLKQKKLKEEVRPPLYPLGLSVDVDSPDPAHFPTAQRVVLLEAWKALESAQGDAASLAKVEGMLPRVVKKMRKVDDSGMMEECASLSSSSSSTTGARLLTHRPEQTTTCSLPTTRRTSRPRASSSSSSPPSGRRNRRWPSSRRQQRRPSRSLCRRNMRRSTRARRWRPSSRSRRARTHRQRTARVATRSSVVGSCMYHRSVVLTSAADESISRCTALGADATGRAAL